MVYFNFVILEGSEFCEYIRSISLIIKEGMLFKFLNIIKKDNNVFWVIFVFIIVYISVVEVDFEVEKNVFFFLE